MSDPAQFGSGHPRFTHHDHHHVDSTKKSDQKDAKTTSTLPSKTPEIDEKIGILSTDILGKSTDSVSSGEIDDPLFSLLYGSSSSESPSSESSSIDFTPTDGVFKQLVKNQTTTSPIASLSIDSSELDVLFGFAAMIDKAISGGSIGDFLQIHTPELIKHAKFMLPTETGFEDIHHSQLPHIDRGKLAISLHKIGRTFANEGLSTEEKEILQKQVGTKVTFVNDQLWITLCTKLTEAIAQIKHTSADEEESDTPKQGIQANQSHGKASQEQISLKKDNDDNDLKHQYEKKISSLSSTLKKSLARIAALDEQIRLFRQLQKEKKADEKERQYLEKEILKEEIKKDSLKREIQKYEIKLKGLSHIRVKTSLNKS